MENSMQIIEVKDYENSKSFIVLTGKDKTLVLPDSVNIEFSCLTDCDLSMVKNDDIGALAMLAETVGKPSSASMACFKKLHNSYMQANSNVNVNSVFMRYIIEIMLDNNLKFQCAINVIKLASLKSVYLCDGTKSMQWFNDPIPDKGFSIVIPSVYKKSMETVEKPLDNILLEKVNITDTGFLSIRNRLIPVDISKISFVDKLKKLRELAIEVKKTAHKENKKVVLNVVNNSESSWQLFNALDLYISLYSAMINAPNPL